MKRFVLFSLLFLTISFTSCVTTQKVRMEEYGLDSRKYNGEMIETTATSVFYEGSELFYACKYADDNNYKYLLLLNKDADKYISGYHKNSYSGNVTPIYAYTGSLVAYLFNDDEEYEYYLENNMRIYRTADYAPKAAKHTKEVNLWCWGGIGGTTLLTIVLTAILVTL
ncbi:MAG: hypothetical protein MJ174_07440 [Treponema sp.]|nr:hypothetical protein [Treponema sp.]